MDKRAYPASHRRKTAFKPKELNLVIDPKTIEIRVKSALELQVPPENHYDMGEIRGKTGTIEEIQCVAMRAGGSVAIQKALETPEFPSFSKPSNSHSSLSTPNPLPSEKSHTALSSSAARFFISQQLSPKLSTTLELDVKSRDLWADGRKPTGGQSCQMNSSITADRWTFDHPPNLPPSPLKNRTSSLDLSSISELKSGPLEVAERSDSWNVTRQQKVAARKTSLEQGRLAECTFTPIIYTKIPRHMHKLSAGELVNWDKGDKKPPPVQTPKSQQSTATHTRVHSLTNVPIPPKPLQLGKVLSPVTYRFSMDLDRYETRLKQAGP